MAKDNGRQQQRRQMVAQIAARMMMEDGISDFAIAKKKAGRQLGLVENSTLPTNAEIEDEIRLYNQLYAEDQPESLRQLRQDARLTMEMLAKFNPHLTGAVLDGTAGKYAETHIHLFADSAKEVEIFLLNQQIPYQTQERAFRVSDKRSQDRLKVPVFVLEGPNGRIKLSIFEYQDIRQLPRSPSHGGAMDRVDLAGLDALLAACDKN